MADYTDRASIRLMNKVFTLANIGNDELDQYIADAQLRINAALGIDTDLAAATVAKCNAKETANNYAAFCCVKYDPTLFTNLSEQALLADQFWASFQDGLRTLMNSQGAKYEPSKFTAKSIEDL